MSFHTPIQAIPPSLAIARYLHDFPQTTSIDLIGPLYQGAGVFTGPVLFVDGGAAFKADHIGFSVGDGDSYTGELDEQLDHRKDYSDLAYALFSVPAHFTHVHLRGFLGGRRDHEWLNLGEAAHFLKSRHQPTHVHFDELVTGLSAGNWQLQITEAFSLITTESTLITLSGDCDYPLIEPTRLEALSSHGLSNVGTGSIEMKTDKPIFIIYPDRDALV